MKLLLCALKAMLLEAACIFVFVPEVRETVVGVIMAHRRDQNGKAI